jgi:hypothetical protein
MVIVLDITQFYRYNAKEHFVSNLASIWKVASTSRLHSAIRELTNNVLIDIPYFMSHHRNAMIESVRYSFNPIPETADNGLLALRAGVRSSSYHSGA